MLHKRNVLFQISFYKIVPIVLKERHFIQETKRTQQ